MSPGCHAFEGLGEWIAESARMLAGGAGACPIGRPLGRRLARAEGRLESDVAREPVSALRGEIPDNAGGVDIVLDASGVRTKPLASLFPSE